MASIVNDLLSCGAKLLIIKLPFPIYAFANKGALHSIYFSEFTLLSFPIFFALPNNISK